MVKLETYIGKLTCGIKARMNNHISESRRGISSCEFPRHVYQFGFQKWKFN